MTGWDRGEPREPSAEAKARVAAGRNELYTTVPKGVVVDPTEDAVRLRSSQSGSSSDTPCLVFTEHGLAEAIRATLDALEGGDEAENANRASEIAATIFLAGIIEKRGLAD